MNAKVKFPEQFITFYSAADAINAYSLASETATHLKTLTNQISKATACVKAYAQKNKVDSSIFAELENLIVISYQLANSQADTYCLELKRHTQEPDDQYDAGDLLDAYSLAYENTAWLQTLFYQIKGEVEVIIETIEHSIHRAVFATLERLVHITDYLTESHINSFDIEREKYEMEWEATKNG